MNILKKENWWIWLLLLLFSGCSSPIVLGALLDVYDKKSWYSKWHYWILGIIFFLIPFFIMLIIFNIQILSLTAKKLDVKGKELYLSPYIWVLAAIIPIIGWIYIILLPLYLNIMVIINLKKGKGEKYIHG